MLFESEELDEKVVCAKNAHTTLSSLNGLIKNRT